MKIRFKPDLDFQLDAVDAVCSLFRGQERCKSEFTVTRNPAELQVPIPEWDDVGTGNVLRLSDEDFHRNLNSIQQRNGIAPSESLGACDFTVEMETGTGKTYVYLRTIFELNRQYGFTKFIVVVPSIAIKEGVYKTLQITEDHFRALYSGTPCDYFLYDSAKLGQVRNFATSSLVHIMVVTVGAINKPKVNNLYKESEKTGGKKPIDVVRATRPIVIVDEPQSVDGGLTGGGRRALDRMNPLCTLRYSATHVDQYHMVYRLDAVDAYERKLVKQIEVASATVEDAYNRPYVHLVSTQSRRGAISATVALDVETPGGVRRKRTTVYDGDDLHQVSHRAIYSGCQIGQIRVERGREFMELRLPGDEIFLRPGETHGDVESLAVERAMIRRTIMEHLGKERRFRPQGIKVLSLFFVDVVSRYRRYDEGSAVKGDYALLFEEEYRHLAKHPDYRELFEGLDAAEAAAGAHEGYFSIDKKGGWVDTAENNENDRQNSWRAYNLIMRDKETLLSLDTPLRFIFSHSALSEGWDNPNVFQICALRDIRSHLARRQTIGRGLRLCVNHRGERVPGFEVNTLTVVARESYEEFAEGLQREIETDTGLRFGIVEPHLFASISICGDEDGPDVLGFDASRKIWEHLRSERLVDSEGRVRGLASARPRDRNSDRPGAIRCTARRDCQATEKDCRRPGYQER